MAGYIVWPLSSSVAMQDAIFDRLGPAAFLRGLGVFGIQRFQRRRAGVEWSSGGAHRDTASVTEGSAGDDPTAR